MLVHGMRTFEVVLPAFWVSLQPELAGRLDPLWTGERAAVERHGCTLWLRRTDEDAP